MEHDQNKTSVEPTGELRGTKGDEKDDISDIYQDAESIEQNMHFKTIFITMVDDLDGRTEDASNQ